MTVVGTRFPGLGLHSVVALLGLHLGFVPAVGHESNPVHTASPSAAVFILSDQAQRFLALQARSFATEFMGCMIGEIRGDTVRVDRIAPADVDPSQSTGTWVVPNQTCEGAGWTGTVGMIHSHPRGDRCWYHFPGTQVPSSDGVSFLHTPYVVDAILCGDKVVWISRSMIEREIAVLKAGAGSPRVAVTATNQ